MRLEFLILIMLSFSCLSINKNEIFNEAPNTLKDTNWTSRFFHYCNYYCFETDSTGYSEDGRVAYSLPIPLDTTELEYDEKEIIYMNHETFKYTIKDTILTIEYLTWKPNDTIHQRVFHYNKNEHSWVSNYEYTYGKEWLIAGKKKRRFE